MFLTKFFVEDTLVAEQCYCETCTPPDIKEILDTEFTENGPKLGQIITEIRTMTIKEWEREGWKTQNYRCDSCRRK